MQPASSSSATPTSSAAGMNVSGVSRNGYPDVRVQAAGDGKFAVHLDPGAYTIAAAPPPMRGELTPNGVRVPQDGTVTLRLVIA